MSCPILFIYYDFKYSCMNLATISCRKNITLQNYRFDIYTYRIMFLNQHKAKICSIFSGKLHFTLHNMYRKNVIY